MKTLILAFCALFCLTFIGPKVSQSAETLQVKRTVIQQNSISIRINILGRWFIITYNSDGYIINIVEDDE